MKEKKSDKRKSMNNDEDNKNKIVIGVIIAIIVLVLLFMLLGKEKVQHNVTFNSNGGSSVETLVIDDNGVIVKPENPTKDGYKFAGWYYNDELYDFSKPVTGDIELEARWIELSNVSGVEIAQTKVELGLGDEMKLTAIITPDDVKDDSVTWSSSNSSVVSVDENGNIKALKAGKATITVTTTDGGYTAKVEVIVRKDVVKVAGVSLNKTELNLNVGEKSTLTATIKPSDATNKGVTWKSSNTDVATVDANGKVTAKKAGTAIITVTTNDGSYTASCTVKVKEVKVTGVSLNKTSLNLTVGSKSKLTATVKPSNATNKKVTWKSSNTNVATVDANGNVTAKKAGTAVITVTTKDGSYTASCTVKVTEKAASYTVIFTPIKTETGVYQYSVAVQKNGSAFSSYNFIIYNGKKVNSTLASTQYNKGVTTATVRLSDGKDVTAKVVYK